MVCRGRWVEGRTSWSNYEGEKVPGPFHIPGGGSGEAGSSNRIFSRLRTSVIRVFHVAPAVNVLVRGGAQYSMIWGIPELRLSPVAAWVQAMQDFHLEQDARRRL